MYSMDNCAMPICRYFSFGKRAMRGSHIRNRFHRWGDKQLRINSAPARLESPEVSVMRNLCIRQSSSHNSQRHPARS